MDNICTDARATFHRLDQAIERLMDLDAGKDPEDRDGALDDFVDILNKTARSPIETDLQLQILRMGIRYMMLTESEVPTGSIASAMDAALREAIREAETPLGSALLSLVQFELQTHRGAGASR